MKEAKKRKLKVLNHSLKRLFSKYMSSSQNHILKIVFTRDQLNMFIELTGWDVCEQIKGGGQSKSINI